MTGAIVFLSCQKEISCENCGANLTGTPNRSPIAKAGPDQTIQLPIDSVILNGSSSSDPDGTISSYLWTKISGPATLNINNAASAITVVKNLVIGTYQFELKISDNSGLSSKDTMQVIVNDPSQPNRPPVANAGADQTITLPTNTVTINGNGSIDPDNNITGYAWTKISGPASFNITNSNTAQTQVTNLVQGAYQFELKVTDARGLFSKDTVMVTVNISIVQPPDVHASEDIIITLPLDSVYIGAGSTSMLPVGFQWTKISGPNVVTITPSTIYTGTALVTGIIPGLYSFRVEASNAAGSSADTMDVLVINDPQNPNTITFKNLKWRLADEYGTSIIDLDIITPGQPNLFIASDQLRPLEIYLQLDSASQWFKVPSVQSGFSYVYDAARPHIWIARIPRDDTWVGKKSSIRIKLL